jgi:uncharacterized protein involved in outer membrane biogenesis
MKFRTRLLIGAGIAVGILAVLPFLLPIGRFIPEIERLASEQLRDPVRISSLRLYILPLPHLTIGGIEVGVKPYLQVRKVVVTPRLLSLFDRQKVIREISLRDVVIGRQLVGKVTAWAGRTPASGPSMVRVESIEVRNANIDLKDLKLRRMDLDLELNDEGGLARARLRTDGGKLKATLVPKGKEFALELAARDWKLPAGPPLILTTLDASGILNADGLSLPVIRGQLYQGQIEGNLDVGWKAGWSIVGKLALQQVEVQPVVAVFTKDTTISGKLSANPALDMRAPSAAQLAEGLSVESDFKVENGVLYNFDLAAAPKALLDKDALKGGETRFDRFSGHLSVDPEGYHLSEMQIASGVLKAEGELTITPELELSGLIDASVKGTSALVSTPLAIGGTVQDPILYPSKMALAGAAAGTALLGPGLGTTVGMKAFRLTGKLFGKKKKTAKPVTRAQPAKEQVPAKVPAPAKAQDPAKAAEAGKNPPLKPAPAEVSGRR